jgi:DNA-binding MarR family transcriptional regulator
MTWLTSRLKPGRRLKGVPDEPRWLTDSERDAWIALAELVFNLPGVLDAQLLRDSKLTLFDYFVLSTLSMASGRTRRLSDLASHIGSSLSRLSNVVTRLERRGLLRREPDPENPRYTRAVLTDAGWDVVVAAAPGHVAAVRRYVIDGLTEQQVNVLRDIACHVTRQIGKAAEDGVRRGQPSSGDETGSAHPDVVRSD